jgi:hypothetical protein
MVMGSRMTRPPEPVPGESEPPEPPEPPEPIVPIDRGALIRDALRNISLLGAAASAVAIALHSPELGIAVGIGTGFAALNFLLLARGVGGAIDRTVAGVERTQRELGERPDPRPDPPESGDPADGLDPNLVVDRPHSAGGSFRLILSVVLVAALLWVLPGDPVGPAGLAIGVILALVGASAAALRHNQRSNPGPRRRAAPAIAPERARGGDPQPAHDPPKARLERL